MLNQTVLALLYKLCWPGSAQFYDCLHCQTNWADRAGPQKCASVNVVIDFQVRGGRKGLYNTAIPNMCLAQHIAQPHVALNTQSQETIKALASSLAIKQLIRISTIA